MSAYGGDFGVRGVLMSCKGWKEDVVGETKCLRTFDVFVCVCLMTFYQ